MNIIWIFAFIIIVIVLIDLLMHFCGLYRYIIIKYLSVVIMCFGHPVYFFISFILALYFRFLFDDVGNIKFYGILFMALCMIIFAILRYMAFKYMINDASSVSYTHLALARLTLMVKKSHILALKLLQMAENF